MKSIKDPDKINPNNSESGATMVEMSLVTGTFGIMMFLMLILFIVVYKYHVLTIATTELGRKVSTFVSTNFDEGDVPCTDLVTQIDNFRQNELLVKYPNLFSSTFSFVIEEFIEPSDTSDFPILVLKGVADYRPCTICTSVLSADELEVYEEVIIETYDNVTGLTSGPGGKMICT